MAEELLIYERTYYLSKVFERDNKSQTKKGDSRMNDKQTLMERVIEQVKKDVADKELQPLALLLSNIDRRLLESFMEEAEEEA